MRHIGKIAGAIVDRGADGLNPGQRDRVARLLTEHSQGGRSGELEPFLEAVEVLARDYVADIEARTGRPVGAISQSSTSNAAHAQGLAMFLRKKASEQEDLTGAKALELFRAANLLASQADQSNRGALALEVNIERVNKPAPAHPLEGYLVDVTPAPSPVPKLLEPKPE